jgi:acetylglutamate kinase
LPYFANVRAYSYLHFSLLTFVLKDGLHVLNRLKFKTLRKEDSLKLMAPRILIKIGGKAFEGRDGLQTLASAIKDNSNAEFIIVHGGGPEISQALKHANRETVFIDGIRVTPAEDMKIVEDVLSGKVNKRISFFLIEAGLRCEAMSGKTDRLFVVEPLTLHGRDLGYVGRIKRVRAAPVLNSLRKGNIPVVSPISADENGESYNVNADSAAAALAVATACTDLFYFTDVPGVQVGEDICTVLTVEDAKRLIINGTIKGGMVAKLESAFEALKGHVQQVHISQWQGRNTLRNILEKEATRGTTIRS